MRSMRSALRSTRAPTRTAPSPEPESVTIPADAGAIEGFRRWHASDDFPAEAKISFVDGNILVELHPDVETVLVPATAHTLNGFRRWTNSKPFPQRGQIFFLDGEIYIDMSPERIENHNQPKTEVMRVLATLNVEGDLGKFYSDGARLVNKQANVSNVPDALFALWATLQSGALRPVPSTTKHGDYTDVEGTPDFVLEIVSPDSEKKDKRTLRARYFQAGIPEYWLIDARGKKLDFQVLVLGANDYVPAKKQAGWTYSRVFERRFRFERLRDRVGEWQYRLHVKPS